MDDEAANAFIRWVRAVVRKGVGMNTGPRVLLLKEPLAPSMQCVRNGEGLNFYADEPELDWLIGFDRMLIAEAEIGFEAADGRLRFVLPWRQADSAFYGAQHCLLCTQEGHVRARMDIQRLATALDPSPLGMGLPRLVLR